MTDNNTVNIVSHEKFFLKAASIYFLSCFLPASPLFSPFCGLSVFLVALYLERKKRN